MSININYIVIIIFTVMTGFKTHSLLLTFKYSIVSITLVAICILYPQGLIYCITGRLYFLTIHTTICFLYLEPKFCFVLFYLVLRTRDLYSVFVFLELNGSFRLRCLLKICWLSLKSRETTTYYFLPSTSIMIESSLCYNYMNFLIGH